MIKSSLKMALMSSIALASTSGIALAASTPNLATGTFTLHTVVISNTCESSTNGPTFEEDFDPKIFDTVGEKLNDVKDVAITLSNCAIDKTPINLTLTSPTLGLATPDGVFPLTGGSGAGEYLGYEFYAGYNTLDINNQSASTKINKLGQPFTIAGQDANAGNSGTEIYLNIVPYVIKKGEPQSIDNSTNISYTLAYS